MLSLVVDWKKWAADSWIKQLMVEFKFATDIDLAISKFHFNFDSGSLSTADKFIFLQIEFSETLPLISNARFTNRLSYPVVLFEISQYLDISESIYFQIEKIQNRESSRVIIQEDDMKEEESTELLLGFGKNQEVVKSCTSKANNHVYKLLLFDGEGYYEAIDLFNAVKKRPRNGLKLFVKSTIEVFNDMLVLTRDNILLISISDEEESPERVGFLRQFLR